MVEDQVNILLFMTDGRSVFKNVFFFNSHHSRPIEKLQNWRE